MNSPTPEALGSTPSTLIRHARTTSLAVFLIAFAAAGTSLADDGSCAVGAYQLDDDSIVDIGPTQPGQLRWRRVDGTSGALSPGDDGVWTSTLGWTDRPDGIDVRFDCDRRHIQFGQAQGQRIEFEQVETRFAGAGVELAGRLVMPAGSEPTTVVVLVHGAENMSALDFYAHQRLMPALGVGVFVYDKRGTGTSTGRYTQDYLLLANDAIAAAREARRLAGPRAARLGYQGGSQGGWVAPLAARIEPVDFVVVSFGLAVSPLDEDREAIAYDMERHGFDRTVHDKAMEVADATAEILRSNFREGYEELEAVRQRYQSEPWFQHVHGNVTFFLLQMPEDVVREQGPVLLAGAPADYDPMPVLENLDVPQLWILAEDDTDAPIGETLRRLHALAAQGRPITTAVYPGTDHGMYEYEMQEDGTRVSTRNPEDYLMLMVEFMREGRIPASSSHAVFGGARPAP